MMVRPDNTNYINASASAASSPDESFTPAGKEIFDDLKAQIVRGDLLPGDRLLSERKLMEVYHRSRPTVRAALLMLERAGFIKITPRRSPVVLEYDGGGIEKPITEAIEAKQISLSEVSEFRAALEGSTAVWAAERRTEEDVIALNKCLSAMRDNVSDYLEFLRLDMAFHACIAHAAQNRTSEIVLSSISDLSREFTREELSMRSERTRRARCQEIYLLHEPIFEAIRRQDPEGARKAMVTHLMAFQKTVSEELRKLRKQGAG